MSSRPKVQLGNLNRPQWFIRFNEKRLEVNENVLTDLRCMRCHIVVVTVAGSFRTGKSWILNQLAGCGVENGFGVADGQTAVTKGIWILCREHPNLDCVVAFLDTEGLHDPFKENTEHEDNRLSTLAFLLSDKFILNAKDKFDNNDLEKIGFIAMISKQMERREAQNSFPEFILLLRDVSKVKVKGKVVEPNEYLENILESAEPDDHRMSAKRYVRENCTRRACFILTLPTDFDDLDELGSNEHPNLKDRFVNDQKKLKSHIFENSYVKRLSTGSPFSTSALCGYTNLLVATVENGAIPHVSSIQQRVAEGENQRIWEETTEKFQKSIRDDKKSNLYESQSDRFKVLQQEGIESIQNQMIPLSPQHTSETVEKFKEFSEKDNMKLSQQKCREFLTCHLEPYYNMIKDDSYRAPNAKDKFEKDVRNVKEKYDKLTDLGPAKMTVWAETERDIRKRIKQLEVVDLRFQLNTVETATKEENDSLREKLNGIKTEMHQQKLEMAEKARRERNEIEERIKRDKADIELKIKQQEDNIRAREMRRDGMEMAQTLMNGLVNGAFSLGAAALSK